MTGEEFRKEQRWTQVIVFGVIACLLLLGAVALTQSYRHVFRPAPFAFSEEMYLPTQPNLCPGGTLEWKSTLQVNRTPAVLAVSRTLWDASRQTTVQPDAALDFFVWTDAERGDTLSRVNKLPIPSDLIAGLYELRVGASAFNSDSAVYRVPFAIPTTCFKKEPT